MEYAHAPVAVRFLSRPNRYLAEVETLRTGRRLFAHVPNPGRMEELLVPGRSTGFVIPAPGTHRKTHADLVSVYHRGTLVSIDSRMANRLVGAAFGLGRLRGFGGGRWAPEVAVGHHRLDFGQRGPGGNPTHLVEVKSSNLAMGRTAMFPDAPTLRGTAHVELLGRLQRRGVRCGLLIVVQREDVDEFTPNARLDPAFAAAFARAIRVGVRVEARTTGISPSGAVWGRRIPVLPGPRANVFRRRPSIGGQ
ncbi:MAG: DNA/RNA nuclease SfsA [Thermoplasmata archaeon]|nr:DNA/RNA nuclease SfsA [Thermoplasmata archaeon]